VAVVVVNDSYPILEFWAVRKCQQGKKRWLADGAGYRDGVGRSGRCEWGAIINFIDNSLYHHRRDPMPINLAGINKTTTMVWKQITVVCQFV
jgi:hypothetical protein